MPDLDWMGRAACSGADPEVFFPERGSRDTAEQVVRDYCAGCPVRAECFAYAMRMETSVGGYHHGIYGGTGAAQRKQMAPRRMYVLPS